MLRARGVRCVHGGTADGAAIMKRTGDLLFDESGKMRWCSGHVLNLAVGDFYKHVLVAPTFNIGKAIAGKASASAFYMEVSAGHRPIAFSKTRIVGAAKMLESVVAGKAELAAMVANKTATKGLAAAFTVFDFALAEFIVELLRPVESVCALLGTQQYPVAGRVISQITGLKLHAQMVRIAWPAPTSLICERQLGHPSPRERYARGRVQGRW